MNAAEKIVFSRTLRSAEWSHTRLVNDDLYAEVQRLKQTSAKDMTILGSGSIVSQLAQRGLIDEYVLMVDPVVLGAGTPIFNGLPHTLQLKLVSARPFKNGSVLLAYRP